MFFHTIVLTGLHIHACRGRCDLHVRKDTKKRGAKMAPSVSVSLFLKTINIKYDCKHQT